MRCHVMCCGRLVVSECVWCCAGYARRVSSPAEGIPGMLALTSIIAIFLGAFATVFSALIFATG